MTFPFNISMLLFFFCFASYPGRFTYHKVNGSSASQHEQYINYTIGNNNSNSVMGDGDTDNTTDIDAFIWGSITGFGQVYLCDKIGPSVLVFIAMYICSPITALTGIFGSIIGSAVSIYIYIPAAVIKEGLMSYSTILCAAAMVFFHVPSVHIILLVVLVCIMSVIVQRMVGTILTPYGIPVMTLPFCISTMMFLLTKSTIADRILKAVPPSLLSRPEDYLARERLLAQTCHNVLTLMKEVTYLNNCKGQINNDDVILHEKDDSTVTTLSHIYLHGCMHGTVSDVKGNYYSNREYRRYINTGCDSSCVFDIPNLSSEPYLKDITCNLNKIWIRGIYKVYKRMSSNSMADSQPMAYGDHHDMKAPSPMIPITTGNNNNRSNSHMRVTASSIHKVIVSYGYGDDVSLTDVQHAIEKVRRQHCTVTEDEEVSLQEEVSLMDFICLITQRTPTLQLYLELVRLYTACCIYHTVYFYNS